MSDETQIAKIDDYAIVQQGVGQIADVIVQNLGGDELRVIDLPRVKIPPQGSTKWLVPTPDGEEMVEELTGVIVGHRRVKLYWADDDTMGQPPDCVAEDGRNGVGDPGGVCAKCQMNQFGTAQNGGRGKACKDVKQVLFLTEGSLLPMLIALPPTSLRSFGQHMVRLAQVGLPHNGVLSTVTLVQDKNAAGQPYARAEWSMAGRIADEHREQLVVLTELMKSLESGISEEDYDVEA